MSAKIDISYRTTLIDVAMGRKPADIVIRNGQWVSVQSAEIIPNTDIAVVDGHIAYVGEDVTHCIGKDTQIINADGRFLVPGLLDGHMHIESGMLTVTEFVRAVAPLGSTGLFVDPHEIANIFGLEGVKLMLDEALRQPIHVWVQMPSCVPSAPGLETTGAEIGPDEVTEAMTWEGIIGLGEMMNFPGVFNSDEKMLAEMTATHMAGKVIGGHYASEDLGLPFHGYVAGGAEDDHEGTNLEDAVARVRQGMKAMLRFGSAWFDVERQVKAITEKGLDPRHFILCTDDSHAETLTTEGHMDRVLRHAIVQGLEPITAIQMMTLNTAEHFGLARKLGMIAPGRWADIVLVKDLREFHADIVIVKGEVIVEGGEWKIDLPEVNYPDWATNSVNLQKPLKADDFVLLSEDEDSNEILANVIGVIENQAPTKHLHMSVTSHNGELQINNNQDIAKVALVERHKGTGGVTVGLVSGFGFTENCAFASTVAHDCHHMIVVGTDEADMAKATNHLAHSGGGQVAVKGGKVIGQVDLQIAGLMSNKRAEVVAQETATVLDGFRACGCMLNNPNMQLSLLALVVIPELRISDLGLVDVNKFEIISVLE
ncbi:MAG: adenine deaminase [Anaerolineae bacterium]|nr:adenine deaminase [Anaerolineae bacterium]MDK1080386.1 adenine deaminase [Anaerolineae bacterium]MDK1117497.1 adenine deaminase [Anaerolineae bacterium]